MFNDLFLELQRLPRGSEVEVEKKEELYEQLLSMLVKRDFFPSEQYESLVKRVEDEFNYSMMGEEEAKRLKEQKQKELDERYRSPGFKE